MLFTYGGWNDLSYVAAEVRDPKRNLWRCLLLGTTLVIAIYLLVNVAFLRVLGMSGTKGSETVAADLLQRCVGDWGRAAISVLICVSCLGAINGMLFTGARIYHALGTEHRSLSWLGGWNQRRQVPTQAVVAQSTVIFALLLLLGSDEGGFKRLLAFAAPFFWLFFTLVSISIVLFRLREPDRERPFRAPWFPLPPLLFIASCGFMLYASASYLIKVELSPAGSVWAACVMLTGVAVLIGTARGAQDE